jgi:DNA processing protein
MKDKFPLFLALAEMTFLKPKEKIILQNNLDSLEGLARLSCDDIAKMIRRALTTELWQPNTIERRVDEILHIMNLYEIKTAHIDDEDYPALLAEIFDPPYMLFYRGSIGVTREFCVSVVGTRYPTREASQAAFAFAKDAADEGCTVVSGLAYGIDSFAHKGALSAANGSTCAVLASGVDTISPGGNKSLSRVILTKNGCIMSEYTPGTPATKWRFPERNRIVSGLSSGTLVADAPENSGALITADFALDQGRDVFFHEAALHRFTSAVDNNGRVQNQSACAAQSACAPQSRSAQSYIQSGAPVVSSFKNYLEQKAAFPGYFSVKQAQLTLF